MSAGKHNQRVGYTRQKIRREQIPAHWVSNEQLKREIDAGFEHFCKAKPGRVRPTTSHDNIAFGKGFPR